MRSAAAGIVLGVSPFADAHDQLRAGHGLLRLLLQRHVLRLRASGHLVENAFRGLFVADEQVDAILDRRREPCAGPDISARIAQRKHEIASRTAASADAGISLPIFRLARLYGLSAFECDVVTACAAPEFDLDFEVLYSYAQNDVNRKRPTGDLLLKILCESPPERAECRACLAGHGTLLGNGIVRYAEGAEKLSFLARGFQLDDRMMDFLLDRDGIDSRLRPFAQIIHGGLRMRNLLMPEELKNELIEVAGKVCDRGGVIGFAGVEGAGKRTVAAALSVLQNRTLIGADLRRAAESALPLSEAFDLLQREAHLMGANLFLDHADSLTPQQLAALERSLVSGPQVVFVASDAPEFRLCTKQPVVTCSLPIPSVENRRILWQQAIRRTQLACADDDLSDLARKFALSGGQIDRACRHAALRAPSSHEVCAGALESAVRAQSASGISRLASKVATKQSWADLVLPARQLQQLRAIANAYRFRHQVYDTWGFGDKASLGNGLNVLMFGPSGTGKTMGAGILANALSLDLYKIDLSSVISKFIGETEQRLSELFRAAQASQAILLFDEADALFGKRSEVKDAHDRYANVETAYLLQKMEEFDGIVILTTNFRNNIDDAFARRMHHIVEFPFPDAANRWRIWKGLIPDGAPVADDADFGFLARQFELSGGGIRNAMVGAAFLAAEESSAIGMSHLIVSTAREMQKAGKIPSKTDFREYFDLIHAQG